MFAENCLSIINYSIIYDFNLRFLPPSYWLPVFYIVFKVFVDLSNIVILMDPTNIK